MTPLQTLIFLDNNKDLLDAMKDYFSSFLIDKFFYSNPAEAAKQILYLNKKRKKVLLVVDFSMPEIDGVKFCQDIRSSNVIKVLYSNVLNDVNVQRSLENKKVDYFIKKDDVYSIDHLSEVIKKHL